MNSKLTCGFSLFLLLVGVHPAFSEVSLDFYSNGIKATVRGTSGDKLERVIWEAFDKDNEVTSPNAFCKRSSIEQSMETICTFVIDPSGKTHAPNDYLLIKSEDKFLFDETPVVKLSRSLATVEFEGPTADALFYFLDAPQEEFNGVITKVGENVACEIATRPIEHPPVCYFSIDKAATIIDLN